MNKSLQSHGEYNQNENDPFCQIDYLSLTKMSWIGRSNL